MTKIRPRGACRTGAAALCLCLAVLVSGCAAFGRCELRECAADARITAEVRARLAQNPSLEAPNLISVQTREGVVYIRGLASTPYQVAEAGRIAAQVHGVRDVQNLLSIDNAR